jgi:hypothetical protein
VASFSIHFEPRFEPLGWLCALYSSAAAPQAGKIALVVHSNDKNTRELHYVGLSGGARQSGSRFLISAGRCNAKLLRFVILSNRAFTNRKLSAS